jgi:hypothetical protein
VAQGVGPEFNPQDCKKENKKKRVDPNSNKRRKSRLFPFSPIKLTKNIMDK